MSTDRRSFFTSLENDARGIPYSRSSAFHGGGFPPFRGNEFHAHHTRSPSVVSVGFSSLPMGTGCQVATCWASSWATGNTVAP